MTFPDAANLDPTRFAARQVLDGAVLFGGAVILRPPPGYCVEGDSLRPESPAFALIAACPLLRGNPTRNVAPSVMTVTAQSHDGPLPDAATMAGLIAPAVVLQTVDAEGLTLLHMDGGATGPLVGGDTRHWRAILLVNGHLLSLALFSPQGSDLAERAGMETLLAFAQSIRANSQPAVPPPAPLSTATTAPTPSPENAAENAGKRRLGWFGRLSLAGQSG